MKQMALIPDSKEMLSDRIFGPPYDGPYGYLQKQLKHAGIEIHTIDVFSDTDTIDAYLIFNINGLTAPFLSETQKKQLHNTLATKFGFLYECPAIISGNLSPTNHTFFDYIFTWNDDLVDNKRYFKSNFPQRHEQKFSNHTPPKKRKVLTLINAHKFSYHPDELYSYRRKAIKYFENFAREDFDLYGKRWSKTTKPSLALVQQAIIEHKNLQVLSDYLFANSSFPSYKGEVKDKFTILNKYKFCVCFENMTHINGYVTEKIWDCFKVRTIPIYLGADNITDFVPKNCFIDMRDFKNFTELYNFINTMSAETYSNYVSTIDSFYKQAIKTSWFDQQWAKNVSSVICEKLNG